MALTTLSRTDESLNGVETRGDLFNANLSAVRLHGYALRRWFYRNFLLREGFPVPVVYAVPMDAFAEFKRLWTTTNSYDYLKTAAAQANVWPQNVVTPLISFSFTGDHYRPDLSSNSRVNRTYAWLSAGSSTTITRNFLGNVQQVRYSQGADFNFQVDFWCQRPDVQSAFFEQFAQAFRVSSAGERQTWITVPYPVTHGTQTVRLRITSDLSNTNETSAAPDSGIVLYHTTFTVSIEGYYADRSSIIVPALWFASFSYDNPAPTSLDAFYSLNTVDLRLSGAVNPTMALRSHLPPPGGNVTVPVPVVPEPTSVGGGEIGSSSFGG